MSEFGPLLLEIDANSFVLELRDKLCSIHGMPCHQISLLPKNAYRPLNLFNTLNESQPKHDEDNNNNDNVKKSLELMLYPTNKSCFSNDFWSFHIDKTITKQQFIDNMNKKIIYLELSRDNKTPLNISNIKQKLIEKKEKINKYELNEFMLWNDVRVLKLLHNNSMRNCLNQLKWEIDYCLKRDIDYSIYYPLNENNQKLTNKYITSLLIKKLSMPQCIINIIIEMIEDGFRNDQRNGQQMLKVYGNWSKCVVVFPETAVVTAKAL